VAVDARHRIEEWGANTTKNDPAQRSAKPAKLEKIA
jgi:hypothetical protein